MKTVCDSKWQEKELKGNYQLRFAEGLLRVWSTLWLITELSNDKEPVVHRNLFFLPCPCSSFEEKNDIVGFFIFILCQLLSQLAQKDKIHSQAAR